MPEYEKGAHNAAAAGLAPKHPTAALRVAVSRFPQDAAGHAKRILRSGSSAVVAAEQVRD